MNTPNLSIIVPIYNIQNYLPRCVQSLLDQEYDDMEIILVDDGSTDSSGKICDQFAVLDKRIRVIHKQNGGLSSARNAGLDEVHGKYILFIDGDDYLVPNALNSLTLIAKSDDFDFIQFHYAETDGSWHPETSQAANPRICTEVHEMFRYLYEHGGVAASSCTKLYSSQLFENLRFKEGIANEDEQLINKLLPNCHKVIYTDLVLYGYFMRNGSIIHSDFNRHKLDILEIMDERVAVLENLGMKDLVCQTQCGQFCTCARLYCMAKKAADYDSCKILRAKLKTLSRIHDISPKGSYGILYYLTKLSSHAVDLFYLARLILRKPI